MMEKVYLSRKGYQALKKELEYLQNEKRPLLSKKIEIARSHGDLKENAEYHAAREDQGMTEAKISDISSRMARAKIIDDEDISSDAVYIGATVTLKDNDTNKEVIYTLVPEDEVDFATKKIAINSPIGKALLGHTVGDIVPITVPARQITYEVMKIERL